MEAVGQFESIVNDSGLVRLERLTTEEITGTENEPGIIERYLTLSADGTTMLQDMQLNPDGMRIGDKRLCLHTLSDLDDLPGKVKTDGRYERLSTDRSDCRLSYAAHAMMLQWQRTDCNPLVCASFRYSSSHSLLIWLLRLYRESDCMFFAIFSKRERFSFCRL